MFVRCSKDMKSEAGTKRNLVKSTHMQGSIGGPRAVRTHSTLAMRHGHRVVPDLVTNSRDIWGGVLIQCITFRRAKPVVCDKAGKAGVYIDPVGISEDKSDLAKGLILQLVGSFPDDFEKPRLTFPNH